MTQVSLLVPGNYLGERTIKQNKIFDRPGKHRIMLPTVSVRTAGTVLLEMVDKNGLYFSDDFSLTFHMHYYKLLKWILVLPMLGMFGVLVILRPQEAMPLPSFSRNTDLWCCSHLHYNTFPSGWRNEANHSFLGLKRKNQLTDAGYDQQFKCDNSENFHHSARLIVNNRVLEKGRSLIWHESVYTIDSLVFVTM